jgi:hypothetical protein
MFVLKCNIDKTDRINRIIIGIAILLALYLGCSKLFFAILAVILIIEGIIGWCSIPMIIHRIKNFFN